MNPIIVNYIVMIVTALISSLGLFLIISLVFRNSRNEKKLVIATYTVLFVGESILSLFMYGVIGGTYVDWLIYAVSVLVGLIPYYIMSQRFSFKTSNRRGRSFARKSKKEPGIILNTGVLRKLILIFLLISLSITVGFGAILIFKENNIWIPFIAVFSVITILFLIYYIYQFRYEREKIIFVIGKNEKKHYTYTGNMKGFRVNQKDIFTDGRYLVDYGGQVLKKRHRKTDIYHYYFLPIDIDDYQLKNFEETSEQ